MTSAEPLQVIVVWDGAWRSELPAALHPLPKGLMTLPRDSLAGYRGPGPAQEDPLVDDLLRWAAVGPTLVVPWRGLPEGTMRLLSMTARIVDRDWMVTAPAVPTPLAAVAVGWQVARLAEVEPLDVREGLAIAQALAGQTQSGLLLARPHKAPALELGLLDFARSVRPGNKLVRWNGARMSPMIGGGHAPLLPVARNGAPRLVLGLQSGDIGRLDLGASNQDAVVGMHPGGVDAEAWGQRRFAEAAGCPLDLSPLLRSVARLCRGCERLVPMLDEPCDVCTLRYEA